MVMTLNLRDNIEDDYLIFDNAFVGILSHNDPDIVVDLNTGTATSAVTNTEIPGCLFRNKANRESSSIKQIHRREDSIQNDQFNAADLVVEIPYLPNLSISIGDEFRVSGESKRHSVVAIDYATLETRIRVGLRYFN